MNIKETLLYRDILSRNLGSEFNANLEWELQRVKDSGVHINFELCLESAFDWRPSPQGASYWHCVYHEVLPEEYL